MKINLLVNSPKDVRSGFLNVDPFASEPDQHGRVKSDLVNLDKFVSDGEATQLVAHGILNYFPIDKADEVVEKWLAKLAHGGTITLSAVDLREVAKKFLANVINIEEANSLLHGEQKAEWQYYKSSYTLSVIVEVLETKGYRILLKQVNGNIATVVAQRK